MDGAFADSSPQEPGQALDASRAVRGRRLAALAAGLCLLSLVLRGALITHLNVHWDEFNFLRQVHAQLRGDTTRVLQTAYTHLFGWLPLVGANEVDQVVAARGVMLALSVLNAGWLAWLGRRLIGGGAGLFAAFVYGSFEFVVVHGSAFRYDPLVTCCALGTASLLVVEQRRVRTLACAAVLAAAAVAVSIKAAFFAPTWAILCLVDLDGVTERSRERTLSAVRRLATFAALSLLALAVLLGLHSASVDAGETTAVTTATSSARRVFELPVLIPGRAYLMQSLRTDAPLWLLLGSGLFMLGRAGRGDSAWTKPQRVALLSLSLPMLSLYVYRNAYPYFHPTILAGACLLAGCVWRALETSRWATWRLSLVVALVALAPSYQLARSFARNAPDDTATQRAVIDVVHTLYPEPVPFIDRCGMVSSFPKVGPFMSTWVMSQYRERGEDIWPELLRSRQPALLLANSPGLRLNATRQPLAYAFSPRDFATLRANYIPFWPPLWMPGKVLRPQGTAPEAFEVWIEGTYTLESSGPVELDGVRLEPREVLELEAGEHHLHAIAPSTPPLVVLRWGSRLPRPPMPPVRGPLFRGFDELPLVSQIPR